jgi:hypothetical protein
MFTAVKGSPELRIEEIGALVQKFPRFKPITSKGVLIIGINKD